MKKTKIKNIILSILTIIILLLIYLYLNKKYGFYIPCIFHKITGFYCPGCGATRCILSLIKGNIKAAFFYNPLFFIMIPFFIFGIIYKCYIYIADKEEKIISNIPNYIWVVVLIIVIIFGILRNIETFEYLRP